MAVARKAVSETSHEARQAIEEMRPGTARDAVCQKVEIVCPVA